VEIGRQVDRPASSLVVSLAYAQEVGGQGAASLLEFLFVLPQDICASLALGSFTNI